MKRAILEVRSGRHGGERYVMESTETFLVGRTERALRRGKASPADSAERRGGASQSDAAERRGGASQSDAAERQPSHLPGGRPSGVMIEEDETMSALHFSISMVGNTPILRDVGSLTGTFVQGELAEETSLPDGAWIRAGHTDFLFFHELDNHKILENALDVNASRAARLLTSGPYPTFAIVDAARNSEILDLLRRSVDTSESLFAGQKSRATDEWAPYLVALEDDSPLLHALLSKGWGKRWGVYLSSKEPFKAVRTHLRRFLLVIDEETTEKQYFRYYDPATLRVFLTSASERQRELLFGPIHHFVCEGEDGTPLRFGATNHG